jgi:hypothetical protein
LRTAELIKVLAGKVKKAKESDRRDSHTDGERLRWAEINSYLECEEPATNRKFCEYFFQSKKWAFKANEFDPGLKSNPFKYKMRQFR